MIDQSWRVCQPGRGAIHIPFMHGDTLSAYPLWVLGTIAGVFGATAINNPASSGSTPSSAFFLALLVGGELRAAGPPSLPQ